MLLQRYPLAFALVFAAPGALAADTSLRDLILPLDCRPGVDCWTVRYVDHDPGQGELDYACGPQTGDGHKGTDFAIRDLAALAAGIEVRAAAAGVVDALRDGMPDVSVEATGREAIGGRECGNGIRLDHGDGWTTWYCHLRRGSLVVQEGDAVAAGQVLGLVGLSGDTSFPHLHFDVRQGDQVVDPFVGPGGADDCGAAVSPLWSAEVAAQLVYRPVTLTNAGIAPNMPEVEDARTGYHRSEDLPVTAPTLVMWAEAYWIETGDTVTFQLLGPDLEPVVERSMTIDQGRKRWFGYAGARRPGERWPAGEFFGTVTVERTLSGTPQRFAIEHAVVLR
jgi:murein DD-endopeptidase MepM/ murein hydrolase activator NlpD